MNRMGIVITVTANSAIFFPVNLHINLTSSFGTMVKIAVEMIQKIPCIFGCACP